MTVEELIKKLKRFRQTDDVCLLDHRCIEVFPSEIHEVRRATKREDSETLFVNPVIID